MDLKKWVKWRILSNSDLSVDKKGNKQTVVWLFRLALLTKPILDHSNSMKKLNCIVLIIVILWTRFSLRGTSSSFTVSKWSTYLCTTMLFLMYLSLFGNSLSIKYLQDRRCWNGYHQVLICTRSKICGHLLRYNYLKVANKVDQLEAIKTSMSETEPVKVKKKYITKSMDNWLQAIIEKKDRYIKMLRIRRLITCICYLIYYRWWSIFDNLYHFFIEVKCGYLVLLNNFRRWLLRTHKITSIASLIHWYYLKYYRGVLVV